MKLQGSVPKIVKRAAYSTSWCHRPPALVCNSLPLQPWGAEAAWGALGFWVIGWLLAGGLAGQGGAEGKRAHPIKAHVKSQSLMVSL